jgi:hypothetical protein
MEDGLSDRALKVLRAALHEKAGMNLAEMPDPALVADQLSLTAPACGIAVRRQSRGAPRARIEAERSARSGRIKLCALKIKPPLHADVPI